MDKEIKVYNHGTWDLAFTLSDAFNTEVNHCNDHSSCLLKNRVHFYLEAQKSCKAGKTFVSLK